ncbi:MAG: acetyl-CoA carboxylase biotin carboxyl carrier protein subunit [Alphaproteobacteria bacterium]
MKTTLIIDSVTVELENLNRRGNEVSFMLNGKAYSFGSTPLAAGGYVLEIPRKDGKHQRAYGSAWNDARQQRHVRIGCMEALVTQPGAAGGTVNAEAALSPPAPMPGLVREVFVKKGAKVKKGDKLVMMEAMKLQTVLCAGGNGTVEVIKVKPGDKVNEGDELVNIKGDS